MQTNTFKKSLYRNATAVVLFAALLFAFQFSWGQIYVNTFTGASGCPTNGNTPTVATNATGTALSRTTITCNATANVFNSTTLNATATISNTSYIEFSATANAGYVLNLTTLSYFRQASASAPNQLEVRYSTDGFATSTSWGSAPLSPTTGAISTWDFPDFTTATAGTVTFRIYPYGTQRADLTAPAAAASGTLRLDDVTINGTVTLAPTTSIALSSPSQITAANQNQGATSVVLSQFQAAVTVANATLNTVTFNTGSSYLTSDLGANSFKLFYNTTNTMPGSPISTQAVVATGNTVMFGSLAQSVVIGTGYFWITVDIAASATVNNAINAAVPTLTFAAGTPTGSISTGGVQTIIAAVPIISLTNGTIAASNINQNSSNNVLYRADVTVSNTGAILNAVTFTTAGSYTSSDISNLKLWYSTATTFATGTSTLLATKTTSLSAGSQAFSSLSQSFAIGTGYLYLTTDLPCLAVVNNAINISSFSNTDFTFASGTPTGSGVAGGAKTVIAGVATPSNATSLVATGNGTSGQINATWVNPSGCYDEIMIVASPLANTGGTPTGNGSSYSANSSYTSGTAFGNGFVMYKGTVSPQIFSGFANGTTYFVKIFTRYNSSWSAGLEVSGSSFINTTLTEVVLPQFMEGNTSTNSTRIPVGYCVTLSGLTANATYHYINQVINSADGATTSGAGNCVFPNTTQTGAFTFTSAPALTGAGPYGSFTTGASGNYTGWFVTEPTGNARFTPGATVNFRIRLNDGAGGTFVDRIATTTSGVTVLNLTTGVANGTGLRSTSSSNAKDFVCLYDNVAGTGRPIAATYIEDEGNSLVASYPAFYSASVNSVAGAWGTIIPNTLANGVRRIETRSFTGGTVLCSAISSNGVWTTGSINTVNPTGGATALVISNTDAPLNCSNVTLDHTGITQTTASLMNISSNDNILSNFRANVTLYNTTLNSISFTAGGNFNTGDVTNFKLYTSASTSFPGGAALSTVSATAIANGGTVTFSTLAQSLAAGNRYFWITADFSATGSGNTVSVPALLNTDFSLASNATISTNNITAGGLMTLGTPTPLINLSSSTIGAGTIFDGSTNSVMYRLDAAVTVTSAVLNSISFTTTGSYTSSDVSNFKLWYSNNSTFSTGTSTLLSTKTISLSAGSQAFTGLTQSIPVGTGYIYLTTDLPCTTIIGNTIAVNAVQNSDLSFALGTPTGNGSATATQTIAASTPLNVTGNSATANGLSGQVSVAFTLPTSCYDEIMIVAATSANTGTPTGNGSAYTDNLVYGNGTTLGNGFVVYKGTSSPQIISGLTNGTPYYFKIFTRNASLWSTGTTDVTATPVALPAITEIILPQYAINGANAGSRLQYVCRLQLINLTANATYRYYTGASNNASLGATSSAPGNFVAINNTTSANGYIVGYSSGKGMNGTLLTGDIFGSASNYAEFTTDGTGSYTGWFSMVPTSNAVFNAGNNVYFYVQLNNGAGGTSQVAGLRTTNTITMLTETAATNGARAVKGASNATDENMIFLYDNTAGTGRPLYGTWAENNGIAENYSTWYNTSLNGVSGSWGAYVPSTLANGIRRIEQRNVATAAVEGCPALNSTGIWSGAGNTVNPTFGTATPITFTTTDVNFARATSNITGSASLTVGASTNLSITLTGISPWTVNLSDGSSFTTSTSPYIYAVTPTTTTSYTVTSISNGNGCNSISSDFTGTATVIVNAINDDCANAIALTVTANCSSIPSTSFNGHASTPVTTCSGIADDDVWFTVYKPAGMTSFSINVTGSANYDPEFEVFTGTCGSLTSVICGSNNSNTVNATELKTLLNQSVSAITYFIRVYDARISWGSGTGNFTICVYGNVLPPANDNPCGSLSVSSNSGSIYGSPTVTAAYDNGSSVYNGIDNNPTATSPVTNAPYGPNLVYYTGTTSFSTNLGVNEPTPPCGVAGVSPKSIWYKLTAPTLGGTTVIIRTGYTTTSFSTILSAYVLSTNPCSATPVFTNLGCSTNGTLTLSPIALFAYAGQPIYIQLIGVNSTSGNFMMSVQGVTQSISLSNPTSASLTVSIPSVAGANNIILRWRATTSGGFSQTYLSPSTSSYTLNGLSSGVNYNVWAAFIGSSQTFYSQFTTLGTVVGCTSSPAAPTVTAVAGHCSRATITWPAHPLASTIYPYRLYWRVVGAGGFNVVAVTTNSYNITGLALNSNYEFFYKTICTGGGQVNSFVGTYTTCAGPAKESNPTTGSNGTLELNGRYFVGADFTEIANYADNTVADGNVHEITLNEISNSEEQTNSNIILSPIINGSFNLIPNPTSDNVMVTYTLENESAVTARLMDIQGKEVRSIKVANQGKTGAVQLDLSDVNSGVYLVNVISEGYSQTKRLVVTK